MRNSALTLRVEQAGGLNQGTSVFPQCGFSAAVVRVLTHMGVKFKGTDVLADPGLRQGIKDFASRPTIPLLYVKGEFVGGCDIMREMFQARELPGLLTSRGVAVAQAARSPRSVRSQRGRQAGAGLLYFRLFSPAAEPAAAAFLAAAIAASGSEVRRPRTAAARAASEGDSRRGERGVREER
jgi:monothiol glutaredoxin